MKTIALKMLVLLLLTGAGQSAVAHPQSEAQISSIRSQYAAINKRATRHKKVKRQLSGFSLEGGELVASFEGAAIVKMVAIHYGEMGRTLEEYYFSNGKLIFMFAKVFHYNRPMGKVARTAENRYYFNNDQLIRWIGENGKQGDLTSEDSAAKQKDLLESSNLLTAGARSKNSTIEHP